MCHSDGSLVLCLLLRLATLLSMADTCSNRCSHCLSVMGVHLGCIKIRPNLCMNNDCVNLQLCFILCTDSGDTHYCSLTQVTHSQESGTSFGYQKVAPNRAAFYSVQFSDTRKNMHKKV